MSFVESELHLLVVVLFVAEVQVGGTGSHWAVEEDRNARDAVLVLELPDEIEQLLRAADGKAGNDDGSAVLIGVVHDLSKLGGRILVGMKAVAIGALHYEVF